MGYPKRVVEILLDTNVLVLSLRIGLDLFRAVEDAISINCRFNILKVSIDELEKLASTTPRSKHLHKLYLKALEIALNRCNVVEAELLPGEEVDDAIVRYAHENKFLVVSNDREVRRRLKRLGHPTAYVDVESKRVVFEGFL